MRTLWVSKNLSAARRPRPVFTVAAIDGRATAAETDMRGLAYRGSAFEAFQHATLPFFWRKRVCPPLPPRFRNQRGGPQRARHPRTKPQAPTVETPADAGARRAWVTAGDGTLHFYLCTCVCVRATRVGNRKRWHYPSPRSPTPPLTVLPKGGRLKRRVPY
jgi:hypothetical protein